jgi:hypothetical protein
VAVVAEGAKEPVDLEDDEGDDDEEEAEVGITCQNGKWPHGQFHKQYCN